MFGKNKTEKEIEQKILLKKTFSKIDKHVTDLQKQQEKYIETAKEAKQSGLESQYDLALSGLQMAMSELKRAKEMKLNFELTMQMKDMTEISASFLKCMSDLSKDMSQTVNNMNFSKVQTEFNDAIKSVEYTKERMDAMLNYNNESITSVNSGQSLSKEELNVFIESQMSTHICEKDDVGALMAKINKELG